MTTPYFGRVLEGIDADTFAERNQGNPEGRRWRRLPEVSSDFRRTKMAIRQKIGMV